jgi:hypothetical protein
VYWNYYLKSFSSELLIIIMPPKMTHDQCCLKVCFICGNEAGKGDRKITEAEVKLIKAHVLHSFNPGDERYLDLIFYLLGDYLILI